MPHGLRGPAGGQGRPVVAWVLAAGEGRRMGGCAKSALRLGERSILETLLQALTDGGCAQVHVLVGAHADVIGPLAGQCGAQVVPVSHGGGDLIDTQRDALRQHARRDPGADMLVTVADLPLMQASHVKALLGAWQGAAALRPAMMAPQVGGQRGHPVLLSAEEAGAAAASGAPLGLRGWLRAHPERLALWPAADTAYVTDLDQPEDVERIRRLIVERSGLENC